MPAKDRTNGSPSGHGRPKTRAEERIESLDTSAATLTAELAELRERAERAEQEAADNKAGWQRSAADFTNFRRRTEQMRDEELALGNEVLLLKLLAVADDFDRAILHVPPDQRDSAWVEGIAAIDRKLRGLLDSEGVSQTESAEGRPFDPREQEAIASEENVDVPDGTVLKELARGYRIRDRILRPALVSVSKGGPHATPETNQTNTNPGDVPDVRE